MRLLWRHRPIALIPCEICEKYVCDDQTKAFSFGRDGKPELRLVDIGVEFLAPCRDPARGCPKGTPENQKTLNESNQVCYDHFRECEAVGQFPDDPIVRRNAALIKDTIREVERGKEAEFQFAMLKLAESVK